MKRKKRSRPPYTLSHLLEMLRHIVTTLLVIGIITIMARWVWTNYSQSQTATGISRESAQTLEALQERRDRLKRRNELLSTPTGQLDQKIIATNGHLPGEKVLVLIDSESVLFNDQNSLNSEKKPSSGGFWSWLPLSDTDE